jgi:hypothetical protein
VYSGAAAVEDCILRPVQWLRLNVQCMHDVGASTTLAVRVDGVERLTVAPRARRTYVSP